MEITRDLRVQARRDQLDRLVEKMTERAAPPWQRSPEGEARIPGVTDQHGCAQGLLVAADRD